MRVGGRITARAALIAVLATLAFSLSAVDTPAKAMSSEAGYRAKLLRMLNRTRERHDLRPLDLQLRLSRDAKKHTRSMIRDDRIFDPPDLDRILAPYDWDDLGASAVGCAISLRALHRAWLRSEAHRAILLHPKLRKVGIAVILNGERNSCGRDSFWASELFYG